MIKEFYKAHPKLCVFLAMTLFPITFPVFLLFYFWGVTRYLLDEAVK